MNENNGGKGLFYGVIGVATLIVAIIGATFAWFTATAGASDETLVTTGTLTISYEDGSAVVATNLKPATEAQVEAAYAAGDCVHVADTTASITGEQICTIYEFTVTNTGSLYADLTASLSNFTIAEVADRNVNTGVTGDTGEVAVTTAEEETNGYFKYAVTASAPGASADFTSASLASASGVALTPARLAPAGTVTNYIVVWLDSAAGNSYQAVTATADFDITANQTNYVAG